MYKVVIASDAGRDLCSVEDRNGNTPLHSSCAKGDVELVKVSLVCPIHMWYLLSVDA